MEKEEFKIVDIVFNKLIVNKAIPKNNSIEISLFYNDGEEKEITRNINVEDPPKSASDIVEDIINIQKNKNKKFEQNMITQNNLKIIIDNKEQILDRLEEFLKIVNDKILSVRECKEPSKLLDLVRKINKMELEF